MKSSLIHFRDITTVGHATEYINKLDKNSLVVYSPTSLIRLGITNTKDIGLEKKFINKALILARQIKTFDAE
jgi:hypothetical protein